MKTILVVDDQSILREILLKSLNSYGYEVIAEATNGIEAIECFEEYEPDCVIMDIQMDEMDGLEALKELRELNKDVPIIMMTGYPNKDFVKTIAQYKNTDFLTKPLDINRILRVLKKNGV